MSPLLRALDHRPFAWLWSGQTMSIIGDKVLLIALPWWVLDHTGSAVAMGTVLALETVPMLLFLLVGGVIVDRLSRFRLVLVSDVVRGMVIGAIAILALADALTIWHVYAFSFIFGVVSAFFQPAFRAIIPDIVPTEDLPSANSLVDLSGQFGGVIGPAIGGAVVLYGGTSLAFVIDCASFLVSVACLLPLIRWKAPALASPPSSGMIGDLREGIWTVLASPWLWVTIGVAGLSNLAYTGPMSVALPFLIQDAWHADAGVLGLFWSAYSVGSILAAAWMGRQPRLRKRGLVLYGAWMGIGILLTAMGLPITVAGLVAAAFGMGACNTILGLVWANSLQECVPRPLLGRVTSVDYLGSYALLPVGYALGGWAAQVFGPALTFVIGGACQTGLIALGLLHPQVREYD